MTTKTYSYKYQLTGGRNAAGSEFLSQDFDRKLYTIQKYFVNDSPRYGYSYSLTHILHVSLDVSDEDILAFVLKSGVDLKEDPTEPEYLDENMGNSWYTFEELKKRISIDSEEMVFRNA